MWARSSTAVSFVGSFNFHVGCGWETCLFLQATQLGSVVVSRSIIGRVSPEVLRPAHQSRGSPLVSFRPQAKPQRDHKTGALTTTFSRHLGASSTDGPTASRRPPPRQYFHLATVNVLFSVSNNPLYEYRVCVWCKWVGFHSIIDYENLADPNGFYNQSPIN